MNRTTSAGAGGVGNLGVSGLMHHIVLGMVPCSIACHPASHYYVVVFLFIRQPSGYFYPSYFNRGPNHRQGPQARHMGLENNDNVIRTDTDVLYY